MIQKKAIDGAVENSAGSYNLVRKGRSRRRVWRPLLGQKSQLALPIETSRRNRRVRQPVERDVFEDVVSKALGLTGKDSCNERVTAGVIRWVPPLRPIDAHVVLLLHGFPFDIRSYAAVAPMLVAQGYRVIVPYFAWASMIHPPYRHRNTAIGSAGCDRRRALSPRR